MLHFINDLSGSLIDYMPIADTVKTIMTRETSGPTLPNTRINGLDGLRAVAVGLVLVYHLFPSALPGGFLGVDIFFVISGFLITSLLLNERQGNRRIGLVHFWRRRARRLLPALALVLLVSTAAALTVSKDLLVNIGAQIVGAGAFVANWVYIAIGSDYFVRDNPELFRNTWSLAIEEQFYVLLPLVLLLALRIRTRTVRTVFFALLGLASAWWMVVLYMQGASATRVYFGTDTHTFGLLLGVALACAVQRGSDAGAKKPLSVFAQVSLLITGLAALTGIGWLSFTLREGSPESFLGGFQLATAFMLVLVWAATRQGAWLGRALDVQPLRWIGERSYGIYLWHWPLLLLVAAAFKENGLPGSAEWILPVTVAVITFVLAALSYTYIEQPIRKLGLRQAIGLLVRPIRLHGKRLAVGITVLAFIVVTLPASSYAVATAPQQSTSAEAINRGLAALEAQNAAHKAAEKKPRRSPPAASSPTHNAASEVDDEPLFDSPEYVPPPPVPIESWEVYAVGDSVMLASYPELVAALPDIWVDASVSRGLGAGVGIVGGLSNEGSLRRVIVVGLGTNGPIKDTDLEELRRIAGEERQIVLVNAYADRWWTAEVNRQLAAFANAHRGVVLADWASTIVNVPGGLAGDEVHPNPSGGEAYAAVVQKALDALIQPDEQPERRRAASR